MPVETATVEALDYRHSSLPVRDDLAAAHRRAWARLAAPGEWWSGAVRIAIAEETRAAPDCDFCRERKAALSPYAATGTHTAATDLPDVLVDVIHRIRTDAERLTRRFYDTALAGGLSDAEYVETVGVMAHGHRHRQLLRRHGPAAARIAGAGCRRAAPAAAGRREGRPGLAADAGTRRYDRRRGRDV